ncbi:peptide deformylase [bacterium]|nr:peptide deformylase [bacterium]
MSRLKIYIYDDPILRQVARPVEKITDKIRRLAADMIETMYDARGVGLAANQVGELVRVVTVDTAWSEKRNSKPAARNPLVLINPEILEESAEDESASEGCLSLPEIEGDVWRSLKIRFRYQDLDGNAHEEEATGLKARCIQHETDHLNGILFIDRMAPESRIELAGQLSRLREKFKATVG